MAPHFYNTIEEIDGAMRELCDITNRDPGSGIRDPGVGSTTRG
jgi:hypothetical protein